MAEPFESRLPAFDPRRTRGVLSGAMQAVYRDPATAAFADTLDHRRLPAGWEDDPHIQRLAADAWQAPDRYNSPFFRAWLGNSRLVDYEGNPIPFYHGSRFWGQRAFHPSLMDDGVSMSGIWSARDPRTSLSYLLRPSHPFYEDEMNSRIKSATAMGLMYGDPVNVPGIGSRDVYDLAEHYGVPSYTHDLYGDTANAIWRDLSEQDWRAQSDLLDRYYREGMPDHVPSDALRRAVTMHPAFDQFYDLNRDMLHVRDMDYDALKSGRKIIGPFTTPDLGEIYPLFIKSERPLSIGSWDVSEPLSWYETPDMNVYAKSLSPRDLANANASRLRYAENSLNRLNAETARRRADHIDFGVDASDFDDIDAFVKDELESKIAKIKNGTYTPDDVRVDELFGNAFRRSDAETDSLLHRIRQDGVYDGVLTSGVHDGGGGQLPATDTFAFLDTDQAKSRYNLGTFSPNLRDIYRTLGPAMLGGGALAAAMGRPTGASASVLPEGWVPPSAKAELQGMEPSGWMDPVNWLVDAATAGGGLAFRTGQAALGAAQDWIGEHVPSLPEVPEEHYEAAQ